MWAWRIDGTVSRMMFVRGGARPGFAGLDGLPTRSDHAEDLPNSPSRIPAGLLDAGLACARKGAEFAGSRSKQADARAAWLELRNKIAAFRLFQGRDEAGRPMDRKTILGLDVYRRLFAAEGWSHRNSLPGMAAHELSLPSFSPVSVHAGVGLRLAESTLSKIDAGGSEEVALTEFLASCRRDAVEGCAGIMEEELGLVARTLYPHLIERIDARLHRMDETMRDRFWHGVGRGIYFAPSNLPPFRAAPWRGLNMCLNEPRHEAGKCNAISGFCFALTMVNLQQPEVLDSLFKHHGSGAADCVDGIKAAIAVWDVSDGDPDTLERIAEYGAASQTARVLWPLLWPSRAEAEDHRRPERLFSARQSE